MAAESVRGLSRFREHFADLQDYYVLIGGTASLLVMQEESLEFRTTQDFDMVLCVEALDGRFFDEFWAFIREGGYTAQEAASGLRRYYRFKDPADETFPRMLELFSRQPDGLRIPAGVHLTPIPSGSDISSLSAILLDDEYYEFVMAGRRTLNGVRLIGAEHLIPLKARAYLDLSQRRQSGEQVDRRTVNKHRSDIVRLAALLTPDPLAQVVPAVVRHDLGRYVEDFPLTGQ